MNDELQALYDELRADLEADSPASAARRLADLAPSEIADLFALRQAQLEAVQAQIEAQAQLIGAQIEVLEHQLAVLLGQLPQAASFAAVGSVSLPRRYSSIGRVPLFSAVKNAMESVKLVTRR